VALMSTEVAMIRAPNSMRLAAARNVFIQSSSKVRDVRHIFALLLDSGSGA
jgi:hypothetical protein